MKSELKVEFLSILGLNPWAGNDSSSRQQMFSSHISQRLIIKGANERRIQTGLEYELGKYTFGITMPEDGLILKIIERYPQTLSKDYIKESPEKLVIYRDDKTQEIGFFSVPKFKSYHQYHGYKLNPTENVGKLYPGNYISKDTMLYDTPAKKENGGYAYGMEMNMAFMSLPGTSEDGIIISEDVLDDLSFNVYETRVIEFGKNSFPLNLYGSSTNYKPFPEIGDKVRHDGILMATRDYKPDMAPVEMSILDCMEIDYIFDNQIYSRGSGGKVVDIKVYHDDEEFIPTPKEVTEYLDKYAKALRKFYQDIIEAYQQIKDDHYKKYRDKKVKISTEFQRLIVEAYSIIGSIDKKGKQEINKLYRRNTLDDYRVEIIVEYTITPTVGYKMTDCHG